MLMLLTAVPALLLLVCQAGLVAGAASDSCGCSCTQSAQATHR